MIGTLVAAALWAVLASLVISVALGAGVFAVIHFVRPAAATRQALWSVALGAAGLAPVAILAVMLIRGAQGTPMNDTLPAPAPAAVSHTAAGSAAAAPSGTSGAPAAASPAHGPAFRMRMPDVPDLTPLIAQIIVGVWVLGALGGLAGLTRSLLRVRGLKLRSSPLDGDLATDLPWLTTTRGREIYLRLSYETETPIAIGFRRPVILIPTEMATAAGLTSIEPLVMHEYAHLARFDDWTNLVQRTIERIFWFNPLVWILGRRIELEREVAADEAVVARTNDAKSYASALWRMAQEMRMPEHVVVAPGAMLTRKQISVRIERLLEETPLAGRRYGAAAFAVAIVALTCVAGVAATAPPVSLAQDDMSSTDTASTTQHVVAASPAPHAAARPARHVTASPAPHTIVVADVAPVPPAAPVAAVTPVPPVALDRLRKLADLQKLKDLGPELNPDVARQIAQAQRAAALQVKEQLAEANRVRRDNNDGSDEDGDSASQHHAPLTREMIQGCIGCSFAHRDLHGLDLSGISLLGDDFSHANLDGVNFSDASLKGASFDHASLAHANFRSAKLTGIEFYRAGLQNADFTNAVLTGVNLAGAHMDGAITTGMHLIGSTLP